MARVIQVRLHTFLFAQIGFDDGVGRCCNSAILLFPEILKALMLVYLDSEGPETARPYQKASTHRSVRR